ncbi:MAG TPA: hypothetical protein VER03_22915 [Bryobacteraceae bacterium]|nr:hypothetical protein [Bryobacteraceae bacterium]
MDQTADIEQLRAELRAMSERLARLEGAEASSPDEIPEEILMVISAAVAAYLGERAHVKQVRLIRTRAWAQQGRVSIQASHQLQH